MNNHYCMITHRRIQHSRTERQSVAEHSTAQKTLCISSIHTLYIHVRLVVRSLILSFYRSSAVVVLNVRSTKISIQHIHTNTETSIGVHTHALPAAHRHSHALRRRMLIPKQQSVVFADRVYSWRHMSLVASRKQQNRSDEIFLCVVFHFNIICFVYSFVLKPAMAAPSELSLAEIRNFMLKNGGKVTNHELVKYFKHFLTHPNTKGKAFVQWYESGLSLDLQEKKKQQSLVRTVRIVKLEHCSVHINLIIKKITKRIV